LQCKRRKGKDRKTHKQKVSGATIARQPTTSMVKRIRINGSRLNLHFHKKNYEV